MTYCPRCGTELRAGAKFCHRCGARIEDVLKFDEEREELNFQDEQLKFSVNECWRKNIKSMNFRVLPKIALNAERIVSVAGMKDLHIFNFDGELERSIRTGGIFREPILDIAVPPDCSRIFVLFVDGKIKAYTMEGKEELVVKIPMGNHFGFIRTSLNKKIFAAALNEYGGVWDWNGNNLFWTRTRWRSIFFSGRRKYISLSVAPDGNYVGFIEGMPGYACAITFIKIPPLRDLLKIKDIDHNYTIWKNLGVDFELTDINFTIGKMLLANNRMVLCNERSLCIFDKKADTKYDKYLCNFELVKKPETISHAQITAGGRYLLYLSHLSTSREKRTCFNIFDINNGINMRELLTFPKETSVVMTSSHDGSKVLIKVKKNDIRMYDIK